MKALLLIMGVTWVFPPLWIAFGVLLVLFAPIALFGWALSVIAPKRKVLPEPPYPRPPAFEPIC